jgi:hypothetical protein
MATGILALGLAAPGPSTAAEQSALKVSGSIRVRQEMLEGQYRPGFDNRDDMLAMKSQLFVEWDSGTWRFGGEVIDSRAYDTDAGGVLTANDVDAFEPVQAYVAADFEQPFGKDSAASVQAGRFTMNLASRRLVASDDFRNAPQSYTGARGDLRFSGGRQMTLFYALPVQRRPDDFPSLRRNRISLDHEGTDQQLWGVLASKAGLPGDLLGEVGYIRFEESDHDNRATRNRNLHNLSARLIRNASAGRWDYELESIHQFGHLRAGTAATAALLDVRANFLHADVGYTVAGAWKPHFTLEYDYASGDGPGAKYTRFDTLFGMRRAELAPSGIYGAIGRANLESLGLRLEGAPTSRLDVLLTWHFMWAADRHDSFSTTGIRDAAGMSGSFAGQQVDARLRYWLLPQRLRTELTSVTLFRGRLLRDASNASANGDTHYLAASLTLSY